MDGTPLERSQIPAALEALARAFHDDAVYTSLWPDVRRRSRALRAFLSVPLRDAYVHGHVTVLQDRGRVLAAAAWLPPGRFPLSPLRKARALPRLARVALAAPGSFGRLTRFGANIEAAFPEDRPAYLAVVGVIPEMQGRGVGATVLAPGLRICDETRSDSYLETANPRGVRLYERLGFRTISDGEQLLPDGPTHWRMRRPSGTG